MAVQLQATHRSTNKRSDLSSIRGEGKVPAVLYGFGTDSTPLSIMETDFIKAYREAGKNGVIQLKTDKKSFSVMIQEVQSHPLKEAITHIDFVAVDLNKETEVEVAIAVTGESPGVKEGGVLQRVLHTVHLRALPSDIPEQIEVSIDGLQIGDSLYVKDLPTGKGYEVLNEKDDVVVSVSPPTVVEEEPEPGDDDAPEEEGTKASELETTAGENE